MKYMQKYIFNIFVLIFFLTIFSIYISNKYFYKKDSQISNNIFILKEKINKIKIGLTGKKNYLRIAFNIENYIKKEKLLILETKISKYKIIYSLSSDLKSLLKFIKYCETNYSNLLIKNFTIKDLNNSKEKNLEITLVLKKNLSNKIFDDKLFAKNLLELQEYEARLSIKKEDKLYAIIGNNVLLNTKWLKINEFYKDYKLIKIQRNYIELKKNLTSEKIKLYLDE